MWYLSNACAMTNNLAKWSLLGQSRKELYGMQTENILGLLYLQAIIDLGAHLTLIGRINLLTIQPLVDLGAIEEFMHPNFVHKHHAIIGSK